MFLSSKNLFELTIEFYTMYLSPDIVKNHDKISISITTLPEWQKQKFHVRVKELKDLNRSLSVNITKQTTKVILIIRKKAAFGSEVIIGSTVINSKNFPEFPADSTLITMPLTGPSQILKIYEPILSKSNKKAKVNGSYEMIDDADRITVGQAQIELSVWKPSTDSLYSSSKDHDKDIYIVE